MNIDNLKPKQYLLILTPEDGDKLASAKVIKAIKRKKYQDPNIIWHVVLLMSPILFYKSYGSNKHQKDYSILNKLHYEVRYLLNVPRTNIHFTYDVMSNVIHEYKKSHLGITLPFNRSFFQYEWLIKRWYWRKIKRYCNKLNVRELKSKFVLETKYCSI